MPGAALGKCQNVTRTVIRVQREWLIIELGRGRITKDLPIWNVIKMS